MATGRSNKRPREDEDSEPGELESSDSDLDLVLSDNDASPAKEKKKVKIEGSKKDAVVRYTAIKKLKSAPDGSIGIPAVRALLAKSGASTTTKSMDAAKESNFGLRKNCRPSTTASSTRKISNPKGKGSKVISYPVFVRYGLHNTQTLTGCDKRRGDKRSFSPGEG
jgi:hypothetical protein